MISCVIFAVLTFSLKPEKNITNKTKLSSSLDMPLVIFLFICSNYTIENKERLVRKFYGLTNKWMNEGDIYIFNQLV